MQGRMNLQCPVKSAYFGMGLGTIDGWNPRVAYIRTSYEYIIKKL